MSDKEAKKLKKAAKRKAEAEAEAQAQAAEVPAVEEAPAQGEEDAQAAAKRAKKEAKRAKKEKEAAPAASTSSALASLADELAPSAAAAAAAEEDVFDLTALKKAKKGDKLKVAVHASRLAGGEGSAPDGSRSGAFVPDENAVVIAEPVRIFLGNLPFKITDALVHECFDEFGEISGIHWVTDKATGQFYGTAFVDFTTAAAAKAALVRNGVEILGRAIKVNVATGANVAGKNRFNSKQKNGGHLAALPVSEKPAECNTVFLGNLSFNIDEQTIREVFQGCGEITDVRWVEKDGEFKGCGFVEFGESWCTDEAVKLNGSDVQGRPMRVDYSARGSR